MQNSLGKRSGNENFECQQGALNAECTWETQRECEFRVPARDLKCRMHLGNAAGMRVSSASKGLAIQNALGKRSGNANFECQQRGLNAEFTWETQRECEFRVPARGFKCRMHLGNAAGMRISSTSKGLEMQNALGKRSGNASFKCQQGTCNTECTWETQRECEFRVPGGYKERPPGGPKGARVTKTSLGALWKINSSRKSS
jgi:hypothetical protein